METTANQPAGDTLCPACGNPIDSHATICAACGTPLATPVPAVSPEPATPPSPPSPPATTPTLPQLAETDTVAQAPAMGAPVPVGMKRCDWCGAENPAGAERCVRCNAMFPRPELDEAMRRAGEARIQAAEEEIALRQRARKWYRLGRRSGS